MNDDNNGYSGGGTCLQWAHKKARELIHGDEKFHNGNCRLLILHFKVEKGTTDFHTPKDGGLPFIFHVAVTYVEVGTWMYEANSGNGLHVKMPLNSGNGG
jgi:hypothetical protein